MPQPAAVSHVLTGEEAARTFKAANLHGWFARPRLTLFCDDVYAYLSMGFYNITSYGSQDTFTNCKQSLIKTTKHVVAWLFLIYLQERVDTRQATSYVAVITGVQIVRSVPW